MNTMCRNLLVTLPVVAVSALLFSPSARASSEPGNPRIVSWTQRDGVAPAITAITQDRDGFLWLGSAAGVLRFDGRRFEHWEPSRGPALPAGRAWAMTTSRDGSLWFGFEGAGGVRIIRPDGGVTSYGLEDDVPESIRALCEDHTGAMWAGGSGGVSRLSNGRWERLTSELKVAEADAIVNALYEDSNRDIWIGAVSGVYRWSRQRGIVERITSDSVFAFAEDPSGAMWVSDSSHGFKRLGDAPRQATNTQRTASAGFRFLRDRRGHLWVATRQAGLLRARGRTWDERRGIDKITETTGLTSDRVLSIFEDREGSVWVGTETGLNQIAPDRPQVMTPVAIPAQYATALALSDRADGLWIGSTVGLFELSGKGIRRFDKTDGLPSARILALHRDPSGVLWVASDHGVARRNEDGTFHALPLTGRLRVDQVVDMASDREGGLWLCDYSALFRWADNTLTVVRRSSKATGRPSAVHADRDGRVWVGFSNGDVLVYDQGRLEPASATGPKGSEVNSIHVDTKGAAWFATANGLFRLIDGRITHLTEQHGLPGRQVRMIAEDSQGYLWSTIGGTLVRFDPDSLRSASTDPAARARFTVFDDTDGLRGIPTGAGTNWVAGGNGDLWFITTSGVVRANTHHVAPVSVRAPIVRSIVADGTAYQPGGALRLPPRTSRVTIDYVSLTLAAPGKLRYRFRLDGFDNDWIDANAQTQAVYANLPPGQYRFRVGASNDNRSWQEAVVPVALSIAPAFNQTWWFGALCVLMALGTVAAGWRARARHLRRQFDLAIAERARISRELHDTMLQGMIGVALQCQGVSQTLEWSPALAREQLARVRDCLEHYVRETRRFIFEMRTAEPVDLLSGLRQAAAMMPSDGGVHFEVAVGEPLPVCASRTERHLLRIAQEAISNAARHSGARHIRVEVAGTGDAVHLRICDDGLGFDVGAARSNTHWGLVTMQERAEQIGASFSLTSTHGAGTTVDVTAPRHPHA